MIKPQEDKQTLLLNPMGISLNNKKDHGKSTRIHLLFVFAESLLNWSTNVRNSIKHWTEPISIMFREFDDGIQ